MTSQMPGIPTLATMTANLPGHYDPALEGLNTVAMDM